jgi:hypothetical protein
VQPRERYVFQTAFTSGFSRRSATPDIGIVADKVSLGIGMIRVGKLG